MSFIEKVLLCNCILQYAYKIIKSALSVFYTISYVVSAASFCWKSVIYRLQSNVKTPLIYNWPHSISSEFYCSHFRSVNPKHKLLLSIEFVQEGTQTSWQPCHRRLMSYEMWRYVFGRVVSDVSKATTERHFSDDLKVQQSRCQNLTPHTDQSLMRMYSNTMVYTYVMRKFIVRSLHQILT